MSQLAKILKKKCSESSHNLSDSVNGRPTGSKFGQPLVFVRLRLRSFHVLYLSAACVSSVHCPVTFVSYGGRF